MQWLFIFLLSIAICYIIFKARKFDFFSIAVMSVFIYYYPGILGFVRTSEYSNVTERLSGHLYGSLCIFLIVLLLFMAITDRYIIKVGSSILYNPYNVRLKDITKDNFTNFAVLLTECLGLLMVIRTFFYYGEAGLDFNKMQLLADANKVTEYLKYIALFTFVYSFINSGRCIKTVRVISSILIGYTFLLGHRSFIVIGIIAIFMHYVGSTNKVRLGKIIKKHWVMFLAIIFAALFFLFVKNVFAAFMTGQYELVSSRLADPDYYLNSLLNSESNTITYNLQRVISSGFKYSLGQYLLGLFTLIPVFGGPIAISLGYASFQEKLNLAFNTRLNEGIGLASTYVGEAYSIGGKFMVALVMLFTFTFLLFLIYRRNNTQSNLAYTFLSILATYFAFYLHRNSLIFLLIMARAYIYIWLLIWLVRFLLKSLCVHSK